MSEVALLSFGCAVSFIVIAAVYIYATEDFTRAERYRKQKAKTQTSKSRRSQRQHDHENFKQAFRHRAL